MLDACSIAIPSEHIWTSRQINTGLLMKYTGRVGVFACIQMPILYDSNRVLRAEIMEPASAMTASGTIVS